MHRISRRDFFFASTLLLLPAYAPATEAHQQFPQTIRTLKEAYESELAAHKHYLRYADQALKEGLPNTAYSFSAFAASERIHARNYARVIKELGSHTEPLRFSITSSNTKSNLSAAARKELNKIQVEYPRYFKQLEVEKYDSAIINCMYSWKSHSQHEKKIKKLQKYAKRYYNRITKKLEAAEGDIYICEICGSFRIRPDEKPCEICNRSASHYHKLERP